MVLGRVATMAVAVGGAALVIVGGLGASDTSGALRYGVSRTEGPAGLAIHWVLCPGVAAEIVDAQGYQGGSVGPNGVPISWQIRAATSGGQPDNDNGRVERFVVGQTPPGYVETVPLRRDVALATVAINGPPGGPVARDGMSFEVRDLQAGSIYRGSYEHVDPDRFAREGLASCPERGLRPAQGIGLALLGGLLAVRSRPRSHRFWLALGLAALGVVGSVRAATQPASIGLLEGTEPRQAAQAFAPGRTTVPPGLPVIARISSATTREAGGLYVVRILAPGPYAFAIDCDGPSIQIGEGAELSNGGTASRQLLGCATGALVRGGIADRADRSDLVEIVVDPNGAASWQVVVVGVAGEVGPFPG